MSGTGTAQPSRGRVAVCSRGEVGLILSDAPVRVVYRKCPTCEVPFEVADELGCTCVTGMAWTGIHLSADKLGQPWSSRTPRIVPLQDDCMKLIINDAPLLKQIFG